MARIVDAACNELGITIPVALHADHYGIKSKDDIPDPRLKFPPFSKRASPLLPLTPPIFRTTRTC
jgi:hypothetical protein